MEAAEPPAFGANDDVKSIGETLKIRTNQFHNCVTKKIGLPIKGGRLHELKIARSLVEKEPDTGATQMLPQIASLARVDLGTCIVEVVVFDEGANILGNEVV